MAHAFNDWNVVPEHSVRIYEALKGRVPLQAYFHQGGHGGAPPLEMMNKWFTRYLYGVAERRREGTRSVDRARDAPAPAPPAGNHAPAAGAGRGRGRGATPPPTPYADYPNPAASPVTLRLRTGGATAGALALTAAPSRAPRCSWTTSSSAAPALAKAEQSPNRLMYATPELAEPVHISGFARITVRLASNKPAANLSVWLVVLPWTDGPIGTANLITRGWADPQNHASLKERRRLSLDGARREARARPVLYVDVRSAARRSDHSGREAHRPDDHVERSRLHALAEARHRAHDGSGRDVAPAAGRRRPRGGQAGVWRHVASPLSPRLEQPDFIGDVHGIGAGDPPAVRKHGEWMVGAFELDRPDETRRAVERHHANLVALRTNRGRCGGRTASKSRI